eukprot:scaffold167677_cov30-Tisochrysis_lutea.AAC.3
MEAGRVWTRPRRAGASDREWAHALSPAATSSSVTFYAQRAQQQLPRAVPASRRFRPSFLQNVAPPQQGHPGVSRPPRHLPTLPTASVELEPAATDETAGLPQHGAPARSAQRWPVRAAPPQTASPTDATAPAAAIHWAAARAAAAMFGSGIDGAATAIGTSTRDGDARRLSAISALRTWCDGLSSSTGCCTSNQAGAAAPPLERVEPFAASATCARTAAASALATRASFAAISASRLAPAALASALRRATASRSSLACAVRASRSEDERSVARSRRNIPMVVCSALSCARMRASCVSMSTRPSPVLMCVGCAAARAAVFSALLRRDSCALSRCAHARASASLAAAASSAAASARTSAATTAATADASADTAA